MKHEWPFQLLLIIIQALNCSREVERLSIVVPPAPERALRLDDVGENERREGEEGGRLAMRRGRKGGKGKKGKDVESSL